MIVDPESVAVALDAYPDWDENMRAGVYHAIDVAPDEPPTDYEDYWDTPAEGAWHRIGRYTLNGKDRKFAITLCEAAGYEAAPTKEEILKALHRGARLIR